MKRFLLWGVISIAFHTAVFMVMSNYDQGTGLQTRSLEIGLVKIAPLAVANEKRLPLPSPGSPSPPKKPMPSAPAENTSPSQPVAKTPPPANRTSPTAPAAYARAPIPQKEPSWEKMSRPHPESHRSQASAVTATSDQTERADSDTGRLSKAPGESADSPAPPRQGLQVATGHKIAPRYLETPPPTYPRRARQRGWQGEVWLRVQVGKNGRVVDLGVEQSSGHAILDQSALNTVRNWLFHPAMVNSEPTSGEVRLPIRFVLAESL